MRLIALIIVLFITASTLADEPSGAILSIEHAVATAVQENPSLAEMRTRAEAAAAVPSQAGSLPDPRLNLNALNLPVDTFDTGQEPMTQLQIGVSQSFPFPGKRPLRREAAEFEALAAKDSVQETRLRLIRDVKVGWWELFYLDRSLEIVARNQELLRQFVKIAETKYEVGRGLQQDVLLAQVELSKLLALEIQLKGARDTAAARLNALLARPQETLIDLPERIQKALPEPPPRENLLSLAEDNRPLLAAARHRIESSRAARELAEKAYYPDFTLGANYGFRDGRNLDGEQRPDFASVLLSIEVPLYAGSKQDKLVDQRTAEWQGRKYALTDTRNRVQEEIAAALADYRQAREQAALFKDGIVPQAQQTVASMLSGYQVNKVDFLNLAQSQITLYNHELQYWRTFTRAQQALAALAAAVGREAIDES